MIMKVNLWLSKATEELDKAGVGTARLDALVLLADALEHDKSWILAHPEVAIQGATLERLNKLVERRKNHEPLAYIRGKTEFYGKEFYINKHVLEPRPESETMIELLDANDPVKTIIDVGTGSGALAISAALLLPHAKTYAVDIDPKCLAVAKENAEKHEVDIEFIEDNLLEPFIGKPLRGPIVILANLPYVPDDYTLNTAAMNEPKHAIFGGPDGLDLYRVMFEQIQGHVTLPLFVLTESLPFQHEELQNIAITHGLKQLVDKDFVQMFKKNF